MITGEGWWEKLEPWLGNVRIPDMTATATRRIMTATATRRIMPGAFLALLLGLKRNLGRLFVGI